MHRRNALWWRRAWSLRPTPPTRVAAKRSHRWHPAQHLKKAGRFATDPFVQGGGRITATGPPWPRRGICLHATITIRLAVSVNLELQHVVGQLWSPGCADARSCPAPGCSACGWPAGRRGPGGRVRCRFPPETELTSSVTPQSRDRCGQMALPNAWPGAKVICRCGPSDRPNRACRCSPLHDWPLPLMVQSWFALGLLMEEEELSSNPLL
jgi:hypothetical protein